MKLFISCDQLKKQRFTFILPDMNIQTALGMLQIIQPFQYTIDKNGVYIQP
jgi:hypothetical protein